MISDYYGAIATLAVGILAGVQWYFSNRAAARQRDSDLTRWGGNVIDLMAELETACYPLVTEGRLTRAEIERIGQRASALVDKGRLFFPNVKSRRAAKDDDGTRIKLLDEVLRACYVARHLASVDGADGESLRKQIWQSRGNFIRLLQKEMTASLRVVKDDDKGDSIPIDPSLWPDAHRTLKLPPRTPATKR